MDTRTYQQIIKQVLLEYAQYQPVYGNIQTKLAFNDEHGSLETVA